MWIVAQNPTASEFILKYPIHGPFNDEHVAQRYAESLNRKEKCLPAAYVAVKISLVPDEGIRVLVRDVRQPPGKRQPSILIPVIGNYVSSLGNIILEVDRRDID